MPVLDTAAGPTVARIVDPLSTVKVTLPSLTAGVVDVFVTLAVSVIAAVPNTAESGPTAFVAVLAFPTSMSTALCAA